MGQKINPIGFRLSVYKNWSAYWFADSRNFRKLLLEDVKVREYLTKKLSHASLSRIRIERPAKTARVTLYSARPGMIIGKKGEEIEVLRGALQKIAGVPVQVNIEEVRKPELDAQLIAASIAHQLERRIMFRRAMKRAMQNAMRLGGLGIKIMSAGRLNGAEIARTEWYREGRVPLHTLRAKIDYGFAEAKTTYGTIGIKVWVYTGENPEPGENLASAEVGRSLEQQSHALMESEAGEALPRTVRRRIQPPTQEQAQGVEGESAVLTTEAPRATKKPAAKTGQRPSSPRKTPGAPGKTTARKSTDRTHAAKADAGKSSAVKPRPAAAKKPVGKSPAPTKPKKAE